ncbi:hypothetical protein [Streptomyces sp. NPDC093109]|uniref:hypothetical protein n=1 Tax=Streptomyces sp. NPDC093109 TaxID=3154977 RepID=UPI00344FFC6C
MKIRMLVEMSGTRNGVPWPPRGQVVDIPTGEAQHLCASGIAEAALDHEASGTETATPPPSATSAQPPAEVTTPPAETKRTRRVKAAPADDTTGADTVTE